MSQDTIKITVDGKELEARPGQMLIEVTDAAGIYIPRFCYHPKLSVAANCRMCLVQVERAPKPLPACATPVTPDMIVSTRSDYAVEAQKATMEFLLINHPLDCPICDQGGECELQDIAMGYGRDISRFNERKRVVADKNLGPLVSTDMTRCIHCTRCVRFGQEVAGIQEMGAFGRGDRMEIGTFIENSVNHELSGNIIDLCPVGALNNKPYRFSARAWEMEQRKTIAPHDCVGSNIHAHVLRGTLKRVVPCENETLNETWLADRDRFSYEGIYSADRLTKPLVRENGKLREASWEEALAAAAAALSHAHDEDGGAALGAWLSPSATLEEGYLVSRLMSHMGCANIDYRLRRRDFRGQSNESLLPGLGMPLAALESATGILVVGSNLRHEVPIVAHRVRKAAIAGAQVGFINAADYEYLFPVAERITRADADFAAALTAMVKAAEGSPASDAERALLEALGSDSGIILIGHMAQRHPDYAAVVVAAERLAELTGAHLGYLTEGANAAGLALAGALPHRGPAGSVPAAKGRDFGQMLAAPVKALLMLGVEPEYDCADAVGAMNALASADTVIALTPWLTGSARDHADVILPIGTFAETSGTFINVAGDWQSFAGVARPVGEARPGWKVLRVLGNLLDVPEFDYTSSEAVRDEVAALELHELQHETVDLSFSSSMSVSAADLDVPIYAVDGLVRRAPALQQTRDAQPDWRAAG
ncbi:MAG: NADH-quinone oxidoreductase subunit NuoG [Gammaproteobacteria bacterium]|nr:NADH-quinone oxidoreductase subunit NuoG [Gammaproteobacteria bacterium]